MFKRSLSWFILVFTLLEFVAKTQLTTYDSSHGFISNNHDRYLAKEISSMQDELTSDIRGAPINNKLNSKIQIKFNPEVLDFKQRHLGVPHLEKVTLFNVDSNFSVDMTSISGSTVHFHSSFFENKKIPPLGNTTFNVVFLGREEGSIESNLFIHTTQGHFKYRVKGDSIFSPYRLRPVVGIKIPLNVTFSPFIYFHNPYEEPLQIVEIYCSGGDFHLELPSGEMEGPKDMWEVAPFETKAIIKIRFFAIIEQNHTSYIRIKVNNSDDVLVVPLEIQVTANPLLYAPQGYVDFGIGGSLDAHKRINLTLCNPLKKSIKIASISTASKAISIELFDQLKIPPMKDKMQCIDVAQLVLNWGKAYKTKDFYGKLVIKYKNTKTRTEVPYYVTVIEGGLTFNASLTTFFIAHKPERPENRKVMVKNDFLTPIKLINISLPDDARHYFQITDFAPIVLSQQEERVIFGLKLNSGISWAHMKLNTFIQLNTNISTFQFPLISYDGKLDLKLPHKSKDNSLDLGMISLDSKKDSYIMIINRNPIIIGIKQYMTSIPSGHVEIVGCGFGNYDEALLQESYKNMTKCLDIRPKEYAILKLSVRSGRSETQIWGDISINTQYEQLSIPVHFKIASGKLEIGPDRLVFDQCFPSKICSHPLRIHSTFDQPMVIEDIWSIPPDARISCKHSGHIMGRATKVVGTLFLNPNMHCGNECYLGIEDIEIKSLWWKSLSLPMTTADFDLNLVIMLYHRYLNETSHGLTKWQNLTMRMDTSEVKGHYFKTRVKMSWPSLLIDQTFENKSSIVFQLTQVGNVTYKNLTIKNPSSYDLLVQIVMDTFYPRFDVLYDGLPPAFVLNDDMLKKAKHGFFLDGNGVAATKMNMVDSFLLAHRESMPLRLKPNEIFTFRVGFRANDSTSNTGYLVLRNNLTVMEVIPLSGRGAMPHFKFGNRKPGSTQPLLFEFSEKHLRECEIAMKNKIVNRPTINLKRSFTAKNNGEIPIFINNFFINQIPCEGYGFKVLNCEPTILLPNASKKIDIAFTPDFTLAKITRTLVLDTSLNFPVNYTLVTTVPSFYLSLCSNALQRPPWENYMYKVAVCLMILLLMFVMVAPLLDSERICREAVMLIARQNHVQHTLDLRSIGAQTRQELQSKPEPSETQQKKPSADNVLKDECKHSSKSGDNGEKYTAVVPTTGKGKKKNRKLCDLQERENHKKLWMEAQKLKHEEQKQNETECVKKHCKKAVQPKKLDVVKNIELPVSEEETSSTTTESSNNEDNDKKLKKPQVKFPPEPPMTSNMNASEKENVYPKNDREKSSTKVRHKQVQAEKSNEQEKLTTIEKVKPNRRERNKDNKYSKKQNAERLSKSNENVTLCGPTIRISPSVQVQQQQQNQAQPLSVPSSIWNENKASFSDVVARNEIATTATFAPVTKTTNTTTKPTMYVEPYKQAPPQQTSSPKLGPIGSRSLWQDIHNTDHNNIGDVNRFFSDAMESTTAFLDINVWPDRQQPQVQQPTVNPWLVNSTSSSASPWDSNPPSTYNPPPIHSNPVNSINDASYSTNYLWGSRVWEPWTPPLPRTPTRTPPGFAPHRAEDEEINRLQQQQQQQQQQHHHQQQQQQQQQNQQNVNYNPFGLNIWNQAQNTPNPWYPRGQ